MNCAKLQSLHEPCEEEYRAVTARSSTGLSESSALLSGSTGSIISELHKQNYSAAVSIAAQTADSIQRDIVALREQVMNQIAGIDMDVNKGSSMLEAIRWFDRASNHLSEICQHLTRGVLLVGRQAWTY